MVIEAQLGLSDHSHLGQLLSYALRLPACGVWLATRFHEEHRDAVAELNRLCGGAFRCFAVEMRLWTIAGSPLAPQYADAAGISRGYLSNIEAGRQWGSSATRSAIAKALDLPPDALS